MNVFHLLGKTVVIVGLSALVSLISGVASPRQSSAPAIGDSVDRPGDEHSDAKRPPGREAESQPDVEKDVKSFIVHFIATLESGDEQAIRRLFVGDDRFAWFTDGAKSYANIDEVLAGMRRYAGIRFETTVSEIRVVPLTVSLASARSKFRTKLTIPGSDDHEYGGVITWLLEKAPASDEWKVILGHTSTPGGPPIKADQSGKP